MLFFYEFVFITMAVVAVLMGELWSRTAAVVFLAGWFAFVVLGYASFGARLTVTGAAMSDDERRWFTDARDGLRHLRLLFGLAALAALAWRVIAG
jgi:hypothetical protein